MTLQVTRPKPLGQAGRGQGVVERQNWPGTVVISFLAAILSWRTYPWKAVYAGIDPSWEAGLTMGFMRHLQWGPSIIFSFGPYGFVDAILPYYRLTAFVSVVYALAVVWGLAALIVSSLRPSWGLLGAGVVAWAALAIASSRFGYSDLAVGTALGLALAVLDARQDRARFVLLGLLGALAGFQLLVKTNDGVVSVGLLIVVVIFGGVEWRRAALTAGVPFVGVGLAAWVAAGQSVGNLVSYARGSFSVAAGYSSAMELSGGRRAEDWYAVVVGALLVLLFALSVRDKPRRYQLTVLLLLAGWGWAVAKEGFVRHDAHDLTYFGLVLVAMCLARLKPLYVPLQASSIAIAAIVACVAAGGVPEQLYSPWASTSAVFQDVRSVLGFGGLARAQAAALGQFLSTGDTLPGATLSLLEGHTVAIEPVEASMAYDYKLDWDPEPVLQGYSAYTSYLDLLDATFLASARAPERILYAPSQVIDGRDGFLDPPATLESMYCHYLQLATAGPWQVLERAPDRCGPAVELERVSARFGEPVNVPSEPGKMVVATFSLSAPLIARLDDVVLKPPYTDITAWNGSAIPTTYRFIPGTAADYHVLAVPAALGYSRAFTPPHIRELALSGGGWSFGQGDIEVTFYAVSLGAK